MRKGKGDHEDSRDGCNLDASFRAELYGINRAAERWGAGLRAGPRQGGSEQET